MWLKKSFWNIPDTFDPEDRRRRQIMNVLLIFIILLSLAGNINTLAIQIFERSIDKTPPLSHVWLLIFFGTLWLMNRSRHMPSWFNGTLLIASFIFLLSQMDSPTELYNGRSTIIWAIPVMLGAIIFRPGYTFLITLVICGLMYIFTPPDIRYPNGSINYYVMLTLEVTDTGPGIPEEQLPDIFEAFRRGSNYAQREQQGAGLGLSIAKEIISNMGGHIAVRSAMGLGSTFTIFLPLKPSQESVPA